MEHQGAPGKRIVTVLRKEYGNKVTLIEDDDDELIDVFQTGWYKRIRKKLTPGKALRIYRQNMDMTQAKLGSILGGIPKQFVSNMENGIRPISKKTALKLAGIFKVSVARFIA